MTFHVGDRPTPEQHAIMIDIETAENDFFEALDRIAPDGIQSDEWLALVDHASGGIHGYQDWVAEGWEPITTSQDAGTP